MAIFLFSDWGFEFGRMWTRGGGVFKNVDFCVDEIYGRALTVRIQISNKLSKLNQKIDKLSGIVAK